MTARLRVESGPAAWVAWHAIGLLLVLVAPGILHGGRPPWDQALSSVPQPLILGLAYAASAAWLGVGATRPDGLRPTWATLAVALTYGLAGGLFVHRPDLGTSRVECGISIGLGLTLLVVPFVFRSVRWTGIGLLAASAVIVMAVGVRASKPATTRATPPPPIDTRVLTTALGTITLTSYRNLVAPETLPGGGALQPWGRDFLLVTAHGAFYRLATSGPSGTLTSTRLALAAPINRDAMIADLAKLGVSRLTGRHAVALRALGMAIDTSMTPARVYLSYQHWNSAGACFTARVATTVLDPMDAPAARDWTPIYETAPCLPYTADFHEVETGGRLAWLGSKLLLSVGHYGYDGLKRPPYPQSRDNDYGKVVLLDTSGHHEIFTMGHRNPQGLFVDHGEQVWLTEQGPQGGDEINLLKSGQNYGWPLATYGTDYGTFTWPLAPTAHDHGRFTEPVFAFVPSVGINNLTRVRSPLFPAWRDDLLVASLRAESLFRVRLSDDRAVYVEPISIGRRLRDVIDAPDGRILLWTDGGEVLVLTPGPAVGTGESVFARCRECHAPGPDLTRTAPALTGIVGRPVASESGFTYTPALARLGGRWTEDRLDRFLADPNAFAPGSAMEPGKVPDADERRALIAWLKTYR